MRRLRPAICVLCLLLSASVASWTQLVAPPPPSQSQAEAPKDALGRTTPRGTVFGFLSAAQRGNYDVAAEYLNTRLHGKAAAILAQELFVVLDRRLPARLNLLSDKPEGSLLDPLNPDHDLVGSIASNNGSVNILLERVERGKSGLVWLFSSATLEAIPDLYEEVNALAVDAILPSFLITTRIAGIQLFEWTIVLIGLPLVYLATVLLNRLLSPIAGRLRRRWTKRKALPNPELLPRPVRLLFISLAIRVLIAKFSLSLLARQFWASVATVIAVTSIIWILILLNSVAEQYVHRRLWQRNLAGATSVLRLGRRVLDLLLIFAGILIILHYFGMNPTAAVAGLGVGGIAVALAAQKTLENVIGGISMIFDQAIRVGDALRVGDTQGTVDEIGLRSTRIRTLDRTIVSVPNGQIATMSLETLSVRDKFWFHHTIGLRYETTATQIKSVTEAIRALLLEHPAAEKSSVRVRFLAFGSSSLDVDVFAYTYALEWTAFLEIQEGLLLSIMEILQREGVQIALPSRTMYMASGSDQEQRQYSGAARLPISSSSDKKSAAKSI